MRKPYKKKFDLVLNLFTSFGYFEQEAVMETILLVKVIQSQNGQMAANLCVPN